MSKKIVIEGYFISGLFKNDHIISMIDRLKNIDVVLNFIVFEDLKVFNNNLKFHHDGINFLKKIDLNKDSLYIKGETDELFQFGRTKQYDWLRISCIDFEDINKIEEIILLQIITDELKLLYITDYWYHFYQSTELIAAFQTKNLNYDNLPKYFNEKTMLEMIDVSKNPGREYNLNELKFVPGYKIWYGKESQELFGREKILNYKNAVHIKELENDVIEMQLMDDISKCDNKKNMKKQKDLIKYLQIDKLEVSKY